MKGQLRVVEVDGIDGYARRDVALRVARGGAAEDGGLAPGCQLGATSAERYVPLPVLSGFWAEMLRMRIGRAP